MSKIRGIPVAVALLAFLAIASPARAQGSTASTGPTRWNFSIM